MFCYNYLESNSNGVCSIMIFFHKKSSKLIEFFNRINPLREEGILQQLKDRIFIKQANSKRRRNAIIFTSLYLILNLAIYTSLYKEYENFAYNSKTVGHTVEAIDLVKIREMFIQSIGLRDDSPITLYSLLVISSSILLFVVVEYAALRVARKHVAWRAYNVTKSIFVFILFQTLYLVPIALLLMAENRAVDSMLAKARVDVNSTLLSLKSESGSDRISYGLDQALSIVNSASSPISILSGDYEQTVLTNYHNIGEIDTFYRAVILPYTLNNSPDFSIPTDIIFFDNNKIAISNTVDVSELEQILSTLANHSMRLSSLSDIIADQKNPKISFLEESEYNQLENKKIEVRKKQFQTYLANIAKNIQDNNRYIAETENALSILKSEKSQYEARVRPLLNDCIKEYGESECSEPKKIVDNAIGDYDREINQFEAYIAEAKQYIPILNRQYSSAKSSYDQFLAYPITPELQAGLFEPPSTIYIKHIANKSINPPRYYYTLLHELVHYYSHKAKDDTPTFIEEGMTDLLSLQVGEIHASLSDKVDGYLDEIKIAERIFEMIGEDKATELYFAKNRSKWQKELDVVCGAGCFTKLETVGEQLTYADLNDTETRKSTLNTALEILKTN